MPITELTSINGVGEVKLKQLAKIGVTNLQELLLLKPRRYDDYSQLVALDAAKPGKITVKAEVESINGRYMRRNLHLINVVLRDNTGSLAAVWFNQPYIEKQLQKGKQYLFSGELTFAKGRYSLQNPRFVMADDAEAAAKIVPIYPETKGLTSRQIHSFVRQAIQQMPPLALLPPQLEKAYNLPPVATAITRLHLPSQLADTEQAQRYFSLYELTCILIAAYQSKQSLQTLQAQPFAFDEALMKKFVARLPFKLTDDQRQVIWRIIQDIERPQPMNRLVQGDVGSGKTVVAAAVALQVIQHGGMTALMAPTELLAKQHFKTLSSLLKPFKVRPTLITSSTAKADKQAAYTAIEQGRVQLVVGTHALIQEKLDFHNLQLAVIDEQHRFGVKQRHALQQKSQHLPHLLSMTATPIPRTLALTVYADLDISVIKQMPAGRKPVKTELVGPGERAKVYEHLRQQLKAGRQAYVVHPLIEESEAIVALDAEAGYDMLKKEFKDFKVGLLHGRMKAEQKDAIMKDFLANKLQILVSTTVIEVGVDVPNASVLIIEGAERFGLAQAHQLRGRVGRSEHQSYCYLIPSHTSLISRRLRELAKSSDGFVLAEMDLRLRGPGAIYGTAQHGSLNVAFANLQDSQQIALAQDGARKFIESGESLLKYKQMAAAVKQYSTLTQLN